jgi:glycosyltransferase involved in cell wall biosynthesis
VIDASIVVPTYRHVLLLPYALESALDQRDATVEVLVVGDGVEDATREVVGRYGDDARIRFFDFPKGPRNGEAYRHEVLAEARGRIVTYLSDDDLLLADHVSTMRALLADADFAHSATAWFEPTGALQYHPWNVAESAFAAAMRSGVNAIGLTGTSHTLDAYRRLPQGWRTTPAGEPTDRHMWLQWLEQPWFRGVTSRRLTHLQFPEQRWGSTPEAERAELVVGWYARSRAPGFRDEIDCLLQDAVRRAAEKYRLQAWRSAAAIVELEATRTFRLRRRILRLVRR